MKHIYLLAGAVLFALPAHASPAASSSGSVVDRKMIFSVAGGALVALAVVTYFKIRSMLSFAGNTPIGVIKIGELTEAADSLKLLQEYARDPMIKGILLQIDSQGGAAGTSYVLHNEILRIKKKKPVIVMIENGCYSAGYWVASAADYIIAAAT